MSDNNFSHPNKNKPRFFYGYIIVIAAFIIMLVGYGLYNSFGIFLTPLINEFGWTRATTSGAFSLSMILCGVLGIVVGGLTDKFGSRIVMTACGCFLALGFLLMSQISAAWQLYLFYGIIIGIGISGVWVPLLSTVARWFDKKRSLMTGIVLSGMGLGTLISPLVVSRLISTYDWRMASMILGIVLLVIIVLASQFLRHAPSQKGQTPYSENEAVEQEPPLETKAFSLREASHVRQFWMVFGILFCWGFCAFSVVVHIVPYTIELGIPAVNAANILATIGGISVIGNYVLGHLGDRIGNRRIFIIGFIIWTAILLWLVPSKQLWMLYIFAIIFGFADGGLAASESPIIAWLFGLRSHGLIFGVLGLGFTIGGAVGPIVTGQIFDLTGGYQVAFLVCAAFSIFGLIISSILKPIKANRD